MDNNKLTTVVLEVTKATNPGAFFFSIIVIIVIIKSLCSR